MNFIQGKGTSQADKFINLDQVVDVDIDWDNRRATLYMSNSEPRYPYDFLEFICATGISQYATIDKKELVKDILERERVYSNDKG